MTSRAGVNRWTPSLQGIAAYRVAIDPADPAVAYVATDGGVFKTTDRGRQWSLVDAFPAAGAIAINPTDSTNVVVGHASARIRTSDDGGMTWIDAFPAEDEDQIVALRFDPSGRSTLYAALRNNGVAKSTDGGKTWILARSGLKCCAPEFLDTEDLAISEGVSPTIYAVSGRGLYQSSDGAVTWNYVLLSPPAGSPPGEPWGEPFFDPYVVAVAPSDARVYVSGLMVPASASGRFPTVVSDDGGASWRTLPLNLNIARIAVDPQRSTTVYAAVWRDHQPELPLLLRSVDGGKTWANFSDGLTTDVHDVVVDPTGSFLYASTSDGVYVYEFDNRRHRAVRR
jgi:photosystem II stability/assembly factor-like uncharacterized protein